MKISSCSWYSASVSLQGEIQVIKFLKSNEKELHIKDIAILNVKKPVHALKMIGNKACALIWHKCYSIK